MRFIGNKEKLLPQIEKIINSYSIDGNIFFDFFSGTSNVAKFFKRKNYRVVSSDLLYFSYVLQRAYIQNNSYPKFEKLIPTLKIEFTNLFDDNFKSVINYLNNLKFIEGFVYKNYTPEGTKYLNQERMFFIGENGKKIDTIRTKIEEWKFNNLLTENEYYILLACLIETIPYYANITGVYAAFHKKWDPRALKPLQLRQIDIIEGEKTSISFNLNSMELLQLINSDIIYLDPPYNGRQYGSNYHLLETVARWDSPDVHGVTGLRDCSDLKSDFCNKNKAYNLLETIASDGFFNYLILSYNSEGLMEKSEIIKILKKHGKVNFEEINYTRFKSNNNGNSKTIKNVKEHLYILTK